MPSNSKLGFRYPRRYSRKNYKPLYPAYTPSPKMATLIDGFAVNDLATLWVTGGAVVWSAGQVAIPCDTSYNASITSASAYDLTGSYVYMKITPYQATSALTEMTLTAPGTQNYFYWGYTGNGGTAVSMIQCVSSGHDTYLFSTTYDAVNHAWYRIRESAGTTYFDTAPDGQTWTNQYSTSDVTFGFPLTQLTVSVAPGDFGSDPSGTSYIAAVNFTATLGAVSLTALAAVTDLPTQLAPATAGAAGSLTAAATQTAQATVSGIAQLASTAVLAASNALSGAAALATEATQLASSAVAATAAYASSATQQATNAIAAAASTAGNAVQPASAGISGLAAWASNAIQQAGISISGLASITAIGSGSATIYGTIAIAASSAYGLIANQLSNLSFSATAQILESAVQQAVSAISGVGSLALSATQIVAAAVTAASAWLSSSVQTAFSSIAALSSTTDSPTQQSSVSVTGTGATSATATQLATSSETASASVATGATLGSSTTATGAGSTAAAATQLSTTSVTALSSTTTTATQLSSTTVTGTGSVGLTATQLAQIAISAVASMLASAIGSASGTIVLAASAAGQSSAVQQAVSAFSGNAGFQTTATQLSGSLVNATANITNSVIQTSVSAFSAISAVAANVVQQSSSAVSGAASWLGSSAQTAYSQITGNSSVATLARQQSSTSFSANSAWSNISVSQLGSLTLNAAANISNAVIQNALAAISAVGSFIGNALAIFFGIPPFEESALGGTAQAILFSGNASAIAFSGLATIQSAYSGSAGMIVATYGGTNDQNMATMQNLVALQNNDSAFSLTLAQFNVPLNLTGYTIKLYTKATEATADTSATTYTVGSGLTITAAIGGELTWVLPRTSATTPGQLWWRVDVTDIHGNVGTCLYGNLWIVAV